MWKRAYTSYRGDTDAARLTVADTINPGDEFFYRTRITASTTGVIGAVSLLDVLPTGITYVPDAHNTTGIEYNEADNSISMSYDTLTDYKVVNFKVMVNEDVADQTTIANTAIITNSNKALEVSECSTDILISDIPPEPTYECNSPCSDDSQCQTANAEYTCSVEDGNVCRLDSNRADDMCQPKPLTYSCNSSCETDTECQTANENYICQPDEKLCRLVSNPDESNCTNPVAPSPSPAIGCNEECSTNADCSNSNHICYTTPEGTNLCRLESYLNSSSCTEPVVQTIVVQPELPPELPQTGPTNWLNWIKTGFVTLGVGAILLLLL